MSSSAVKYGINLLVIIDITYKEEQKTSWPNQERNPFFLFLYFVLKRLFL